MKLMRVHVTNFRCIDDSHLVEIGTNTCLVGALGHHPRVGTFQ